MRARPRRPGPRPTRPAGAAAWKKGERPAGVPDDAVQPDIFGNCPKGHRISENYAQIQFCIDINECREQPGICGRGTCVDLKGSYTCRCPRQFPFNGVTCEEACRPGFVAEGGKCVDVDECAAVDRDGKGPCAALGGGICINTRGSFRCGCDPEGKMCGPYGSCHEGSGTGISCVCDVGFEVDKSSGEELCEDVDECAAGTHTCGRHPCMNAEGGFRCDCPEDLDPIQTSSATYQVGEVCLSPGLPVLWFKYRALLVAAFLAAAGAAAYYHHQLSLRGQATPEWEEFEETGLGRLLHHAREKGGRGPAPTGTYLEVRGPAPGEVRHLFFVRRADEMRHVRVTEFPHGDARSSDEQGRLQFSHDYLYREKQAKGQGAGFPVVLESDLRELLEAIPRNEWERARQVRPPPRGPRAAAALAKGALHVIETVPVTFQPARAAVAAGCCGGKKKGPAAAGDRVQGTFQAVLPTRGGAIVWRDADYEFREEDELSQAAALRPHLAGRLPAPPARSASRAASRRGAGAAAQDPAPRRSGEAAGAAGGGGEGRPSGPGDATAGARPADAPAGAGGAWEGPAAARPSSGGGWQAE